MPRPARVSSATKSITRRELLSEKPVKFIQNPLDDCGMRIADCGIEDEHYLDFFSCLAVLIDETIIAMISSHSSINN
jgi:hypothetical protein